MTFIPLSDTSHHIEADHVKMVKFRKSGAKPFDYRPQHGMSWDHLTILIKHNINRGYSYKIVLKGA